MGRLLRLVLERLVGAGNLRVTTAAGTAFMVGDGSGRPVAIRFTSRAAELGFCSILSSDSAKPTWTAAL